MEYKQLETFLRVRVLISSARFIPMPTLEENPVVSREDMELTPTMSTHFGLGPLMCECEGAIRNSDMVLMQDNISQIFPKYDSQLS